MKAILLKKIKLFGRFQRYWIWWCYSSKISLLNVEITTETFISFLYLFNYRHPPNCQHPMILINQNLQGIRNREGQGELWTDLKVLGGGEWLCWTYTVGIAGCFFLHLLCAICYGLEKRFSLFIWRKRQSWDNWMQMKINRFLIFEHIFIIVV